MIKEIWGNGIDVIIKFVKNGVAYWGDSKWNGISYQYTNTYLKNEGFRRLK